MTDLADADRSYKVGRVLSEYGLTSLHEQLPALWTGRTWEVDEGAEAGEADGSGEAGEAVDARGDEEAASLRDLADRINVALVRSAMEDAGEDPLDGEAENAYRLLSGEEVSAGVRIQQRNRLERAGVDVDSLESDFVTHQAVHTYLTDGLGVTKSVADDVDPIETHEERIQRLRNRLAAVVDGSIADLEAAEELDVGDVDTTIGLQLYCRECQTQFELTELLEQGGCHCA